MQQLPNLISNKLDQPPPILSESINSRRNQSKFVVEKMQLLCHQFIAIRYMKGGYVSAVLYRVLRFTANTGGEVRPSPYLSFSLSLSLCVRACVRSSREWKRPRIKFRPRRKVGRACAGRRNCTFASLNNHTSPSNNRPTREISPDLCARAFNLSLSLSRSNRFSGIRDKITGKMGEEMEEEER